MPFVKGQKKTPGSGRTKGTPNKVQQTLREKAAELGVDTFQVMCLFAKGDWKALGYENECYFVERSDGSTKMGYVISPEMRLKAACEATQYQEPKRKSVEHSGPNGGPIEHRDTSSLTDAEIDAKLKELERKRK